MGVDVVALEARKVLRLRRIVRVANSSAALRMTRNLELGRLASLRIGLTGEAPIPR
jgi:hypothetical protein